VCLQLILRCSCVRLPLRKQRVPVHDDEDEDGDGEMMLGRRQLETEWIFASVKHARAALGGEPRVRPTSCTKLLSLACFTLTWCRARTLPLQHLRCDQLAASPAVCVPRLRTIVRAFHNL
jgi:hypothetical protein